MKRPRTRIIGEQERVKERKKIKKKARSRMSTRRNGDKSY